MKAVGFSQQALGRLLTGALALGAVTVQANHVRSPGTWTPPCPTGLACMPEGREGFAMTQIGRASCRKECERLCRSRWSPYH